MTTFVDKILAVHAQLLGGGIPHAFGGAIALGYHIEAPRATADIDINILFGVERSTSAFESLPADVSWTEADVRSVERDGQVRLFWDRTPLDVFFPQHELHDVMSTRIISVPFATTTIPVLSATDLAVFKAMFDRPRDWVDIAAMLEYGSLDRDEVREWLVRILGANDARTARFEALSQ